MKPATVRRLQDALGAGREIERLMAPRSFEDLREDRLLQLAVLKLLEIVGEALNRARKGERHIESEVRHLRRFVNLRNQIVHDYDKVDLAIIWQVIINGLPALLRSIEQALGDRSHGRQDRGWAHRHGRR